MRFVRSLERLGKVRRPHQVVAGTDIQDPHWEALGRRRLCCRRRRRPDLSLSASAVSRLADRARNTRLSSSARGLHLRSHRRGLVQDSALGALLATSTRVVEVPADELALALAFSFALALSLLGSCSCNLRLELSFRLRLSFRLDLHDDLGVVAVGTRTPSSARLAVADGEARGLLLHGVRNHERDIRTAVLARPIHLLRDFPTKSFDSRFGGLRFCHPLNSRVSSGVELQRAINSNS